MLKTTSLATLFALTGIFLASCENAQHNAHDTAAHSDEAPKAEHSHGDASGGSAQSIVRIMQTLNVNTHDITDGILLNDFAKIEASSYAIAHHDPIAQDDLDTLFERLGPRKSAFIACDKGVHDAAVTLNTVSKTKEMKKIVDAYAVMIEAVAICHHDFKPAVSHP